MLACVFNLVEVDRVDDSYNVVYYYVHFCKWVAKSQVKFWSNFDPLWLMVDGRIFMVDITFWVMVIKMVI